MFKAYNLVWLLSRDSAQHVCAIQYTKVICCICLYAEVDPLQYCLHIWALKQLSLKHMQWPGINTLYPDKKRM